MGTVRAPGAGLWISRRCDDVAAQAACVHLAVKVNGLFAAAVLAEQRFENDWWGILHVWFSLLAVLAVPIAFTLGIARKFARAAAA